METRGGERGSDPVTGYSGFCPLVGDMEDLLSSSTPVVDSSGS
jgi:hypothetical protein